MYYSNKIVAVGLMLLAQISIAQTNPVTKIIEHYKAELIAIEQQPCGQAPVMESLQNHFETLKVLPQAVQLKNDLSPIVKEISQVTLPDQEQMNRLIGSFESDSRTSFFQRRQTETMHETMAPRPQEGLSLSFLKLKWLQKSLDKMYEINQKIENDKITFQSQCRPYAESSILQAYSPNKTDFSMPEGDSLYRIFSTPKVIAQVGSDLQTQKRIYHAFAETLSLVDQNVSAKNFFKAVCAEDTECFNSNMEADGGVGNHLGFILSQTKSLATKENKAVVRVALTRVPLAIQVLAEQKERLLKESIQLNKSVSEIQLHEEMASKEIFCAYIKSIKPIADKYAKAFEKISETYAEEILEYKLTPRLINGWSEHCN